MSAALQPAVALTLVRKLSALAGYPRLADGESWAAEKLCESVVSVDHARAVIDAFEERFPTLREIRDTADNLRPKFQKPSASEKEKWIAEGATYDPDWSREVAANLTAESESFHERHAREWKAVMAAARQMSDERRRMPGWKLAAALSHSEIATIRKRLGFELTPFDRQVLAASG